MNLIMKYARVLVLAIPGLWSAGPAFADDGDGSSVTLCDNVFEPGGVKGPFPCPDFGHGASTLADLSRPGSVILFPKFVKGGVDAGCGAGNVLVDGICLPRTEIELGAVCPTLFTVANAGSPSSQPPTPCPEHELVRVRFRWVCPGTQDFEHKFICSTTGFDVHLTVNGKVVFTANGLMSPDSNQDHVSAAPCDRGYLIGWVINEVGEPIKYDGLIGEAVIRSSGTAAAAYRGIPIQAFKESQTRSLITPVQDPLGSQRLGLPFFGLLELPDFPNPYRAVTGQVTGDVTFDKPAPVAGPGFGVSSSLILLTLDVRSNTSNFPTFVDLNFWNGFEERLSTFVEFVCWGEFRLSDIDDNLTQEFMGSRKGIVQSDEAFKENIFGIFDIAGHTTLLGLVQTDEIPADGQVARSHIVEFYNNGIRYWSTAFFP